MQNSMKINVTYTLKDLRKFVHAKTHPGAVGKITYIILGLMFSIACILIAFAIATSDEDGSLLTMIPIIIGPLVLFLIFQAPTQLNYFIMRSDFKKSKLLNKPQCLEFAEDKLIISSSDSNFFVLYKNIFKVKELKPCFVIYLSPAKYFLLPRRCLSGQEQLELLRSILKEKIDKKKLKLKKYPLGKISVDKDIEKYEKYEKPMEGTLATQEEQPLYELQLSLVKDELLAVNFRLFYTTPSGIIMTAIGVLLLVLYIVNLASNGSSPIIRLLIGIFFTVYPPVMIYIRTKRGFEKDAALQKFFTYRFYENYYFVVSEVNETKVLLSDVVKTKETKTAFLIFVTKYIAHIIPKRVFEGDEEKMRNFKNIISKKA